MGEWLKSSHNFTHILCVFVHFSFEEGGTKHVWTDTHECASYKRVQAAPLKNRHGNSPHNEKVARESLITGSSPKLRFDLPEWNAV